MSVETHDFTYSTSALGYMPECSCGWTGEEDWEDLDDAQLEWEDHTDDVFYEATTRLPPKYLLLVVAGWLVAAMVEVAG